jgi:hypothetical protein
MCPLPPIIPPLWFPDPESGPDIDPEAIAVPITPTKAITPMTATIAIIFVVFISFTCSEKLEA